jgi:dipeptidyl-peptidase-4
MQRTPLKPNTFLRAAGLAALLSLSSLAFEGLALAQSPAALPAISLERLYADPPLAGRLPRQAEISPGGAWVSFLQPSAQDSEQLELWAQPAAGGAPRKLVAASDLLGGRTQQLTEAEKMALERKRISARGITAYQWCGNADQALLFPLSGDLYLVRLSADGAKAQRLTFDEKVPEQDPVCSPDGRQVAYVKGGNLWVQSLVEADGQTRQAQQLTHDASATLSYGLADFIAAEELGRQRGFWWAPDGKRLLVLKVDESGVPIKLRAQIFADRTGMTEQRYPAAGEANARVNALVIDAVNGAQTPLALPGEAEYIARAGFFADGVPWVQWFTRDQKRLVLVEFDLARQAAARTVLEERDEAWVNERSSIVELKGKLLSGKPALLWMSEASGRQQLQMVDRQSGARLPLTAQAEAVERVVCSDGQQVVFEGNTDRGRAQELFVVDLNGRTRLLGGSGLQQSRSASGDRQCQRLLVQRSAWGQPPQMELRGVSDKAPVIALAGDAPDALLAQIVPHPQVLEILAADGKTPLNAIYLPPTKPAAAGSKNAVLTLAYGGPTGATVGWRWNGDTARLAYWQQRGYGIFMLDTRGMAHRDRDFTRAHYHAFGQVEVDDLFSAVRQLPKLVPSVDAARIGFFGWSYGGFLAARAMLDANTPFAAAAAGAPVTDWTLYDTAYTERYLGLPKLADGKLAAPYASADLSLRASLLSKPLLLIHGTADDNVLFEHSLRLIEALQNESKVFDVMIYPGKAHGIAGRRAKLHLARTIDAFFERNLRP